VNTKLTAATDNVVVLECRSCERAQDETRDTYCTNCWSEDLQAREIAGTGRLLSWCVYHKDYGLAGFVVPYAVGLVALDEGPLVRCYLDGDWRTAEHEQPIRIRGVRGGLAAHLGRCPGDTPSAQDRLTGLVVLGDETGRAAG
jgi:uncharacterized OB-fold protein